MIPRTLRNATKSEKRKFREDERERFAKLRRVIDEGGVDDYAYKKEIIVSFKFFSISIGISEKINFSRNSIMEPEPLKVV